MHPMLGDCIVVGRLRCALGGNSFAVSWARILEVSPSLYVSPSLQHLMYGAHAQRVEQEKWSTPLPNLHCLDSGKDITMHGLQ